MKYYEMHEIVYRRLKEENYLSWDKSKTFEQMWSHSTNIYLQNFYSKPGRSFRGLEVLDLGTGTGTSALFVAKEGATSVGVEIAASAIELAKKNASHLGLKVDFILGDVLELEMQRKFDLVIDSTILHCLVGEADRRNFYNVVKRHLKHDGLLFINTMIASGDMSSRFPKEFFLFQDDVLWSLGINEISDRKVIDGKSYFPHRTLLTEQKQLDEFKDNGFEIVEIERLSGANGGYDLAAFLKLR